MIELTNGCVEERYARPEPTRSREAFVDLDAPAPLNVLLVEDDDADAYLIRVVMEFVPRIGEIVRAKDGVEALELIDERCFCPDVAFLDLQMPRKDGFDVLLDLKRRDAGFPVVVLSSSPDRSDRVRSAYGGAHMFLTKPNSLAPLYAMIEKVIKSL